MLNNTTNLFSQESNLHSISVLYRFLKIAFNNPRLINRVKTNMPRIIIPILTPIGVLTAILVLSVIVALFVEGVASVTGCPSFATQPSCTNIGELMNEHYKIEKGNFLEDLFCMQGLRASTVLNWT